jgi:hypothetical protein
VKVRLRATVSATNRLRKQNQFVYNIIQNVTKQSMLNPKAFPPTLTAVYMIYKITNKDTNPRRMWKRLGINKTTFEFYNSFDI